MGNSPMSESRKLRVFLCHASQDKPVVRELYQRLLAEGWIDPWLDQEKLLPGQDWDLEIEKAVESADAVMVCLSSRSVSKEGYIQKELRFVLDIALEKPEDTIFVIPLRLDECEVPRRLRSWQYADYFPEIRDSAYGRLIASLKERQSALKTPIIDSASEIPDVTFQNNLGYVSSVLLEQENQRLQQLLSIASQKAFWGSQNADLRRDLFNSISLKTRLLALLVVPIALLPYGLLLVFMEELILNNNLFLYLVTSIVFSFVLISAWLVFLGRTWRKKIDPRLISLINAQKEKIRQLER